ncbi:MAG: PAS domain S-box protein [Marinospirillum sp.]|uniref:ATP-binding protein n=1 Tax=Marinospirillum sp. TaxID=2183934 RepID=UPI0019E407D0|nr:ATP-binding protein [Marinospirillum sp.]MBE0506245.1 PAS domain S-box protein [Marinospirillum sp.]
MPRRVKAQRLNQEARKLQQDQEELALLRMAVSRLNDVIIITEAEPLGDLGPKIVFVNEAFERITGYSKEEVIGRSPRLLQGPDTQASELRRIGNALRQWQPVRGELLNYRKNGEPFWFELDIVPLADETGWFTHWVAVERDITQQKQMQQQLMHVQRMESVGQLTGGIAHDFNNLLTVISGNLELLVEQLAAQPQLQLLAKTSARAADRGTQLTRSLLTFAREQMLQPVEVCINQLIDDMLPLLESSVGERMNIKLYPGVNLWPALIDESYLESILLNLVINARDATPLGGAVILETANITLDENYAARNAEVTAGDYVMLVVSDSGSGIQPEIIDRIFDPFFTTKDKTRGTGLGLSMVFGFIKQSGGHISVYSEPGQGTCFRLYLPRATKDVRTSALPRRPVVAAEPQGKTLLVAEDNELVRAFAVSQLQATGYSVIAVETGDEALAVIKAGKAVDLLFTDVIMPGALNGLQLAEAVRQLKPELPVVFTSGFTADAFPHPAGQELPEKLLIKPYKRQDLLEAIASKLETIIGK